MLRPSTQVVMVEKEIAVEAVALIAAEETALEIAVEAMEIVAEHCSVQMMVLDIILVL